MRAGSSRVILVLLIVVLVVWGVAMGTWIFGGKRQSQAEYVDISTGGVRVMTANVRISSPDDGENVWQNRREFLVKTLRKYDPDLIGCQEVTPAQGAYLTKELRQWYDHYPRAGVGGGGKTEGRKNWKESVNLTFASLNTLYFRADRFEIVDGEAGLVLPGQLQRNPTENTFYTLAVLREISHRQTQTDFGSL